MAAGDYDQRITFQRPVTTPDGVGGGTLSWSDVTPRRWASVQPVRQSESEREGALRATRTYLFKLWRDESINESMRILWRSEICNIREIRRGGPREMTMTIVADAGVTQ